MSHRHAVGAAVDYDRLGALQFGILIDQGLREYNTVLDVGCGPLRLGRILIPWLKSGGYHGIDPAELVVEDAIEYEVGPQMTERKNPEFRYRGDFQFDSFGHDFDFIIVHSVFIHMPFKRVARCLDEAARVLAPGGKVLFSYKPGPTTETKEWAYPEHVTHSDVSIGDALVDADLSGTWRADYAADNFAHQWVIAKRNP